MSRPNDSQHCSPIIAENCSTAQWLRTTVHGSQQIASTSKLTIRYTTSIIFRNIYSRQWPPKSSWHIMEIVIGFTNFYAPTADGLHRGGLPFIMSLMRALNWTKRERNQSRSWGRKTQGMNTTTNSYHVFVFLYSFLVLISESLGMVISQWWLWCSTKWTVLNTILIIALLVMFHWSMFSDKQEKMTYRVMILRL